jgi:hypothetical protein
MAGRGPQSFKKRQKEQQRKEKHQEKLARRMERRLQAKTPTDQEIQRRDVSEAGVS